MMSATNLPVKRFGNIKVYQILSFRGWEFGVRVDYVCEDWGDIEPLTKGIIWKGVNLSDPIYSGYQLRLYGSPIAADPVVDIAK